MKAHWVAYDNLSPINIYSKDMVMVKNKLNIFILFF